MREFDCGFDDEVEVSRFQGCLNRGPTLPFCTAVVVGRSNKPINRYTEANAR